jgi:beta-glucosidase/6-phospho-beta-glucosidase/beta-galactosidase
MKLFKTFFMGGYECADHMNNRGNRVDILSETAHDERTAEDYLLLKAAGIETVREGIRWSYVEKHPYVYNFSEVKNRINAAKQAGIQQIWDVCHFGFPTDLMPSHPQFSERLAGVSKAFAELYISCTNEPLIIIPVNEISFLSWLGGDVRGTVPFAINSGFDVKYFLCKAAIKSIEAVKNVVPTAKILIAEPLMKVHPQDGQTINNIISELNEIQYQAMDIITGRMCPELGGRPDYMDVAGFNYYYENQWEHCGPVLPWDEYYRKTSFSQLLMEAYLRYKKPVIISETGHFKEDRSAWLELFTEDCIKAIKDGVDLKGICLYPVLDRPDWDNFEYISCGVWGYDDSKNRIAEQNYLATLKSCIQKVDYCLQQKDQQSMPLHAV